jgi:hypothetical protein
MHAAVQHVEAINAQIGEYLKATVRVPTLLH